VDLGRDASPRRYREALSILLEDPGATSLLVMHTANALAPGEACAAEVVDTLRGSDRFALACWLGADPAGTIHRRFTEAGIASYPTPEKAARAFLRMVDYQRNQYLLSQTPSTPPPDKATTRMRARARAIVAAALEEGRYWLHEEEGFLLLQCYGVDALPARLASRPDEAARLARELGLPVSLRLSMRPPTDGALLDSEAGVREAAAALLATPGALLAGMPEPRVVLQPAPRRPNALVLMAGIATDPVFGRVLHLGPGGLQKRIKEGGALSLPPLNMALAEEMIGRTRIADMVAQTFDRSRVNEPSLRSLLVRLSDMAVDLPELALLQLNPLLADDQGVLALNVHLAIEPARPDRLFLAIRPYPAELEEELALRDGPKVLARPVRSEDEPAYTELLRRTDPAGVPSRLGRVGLVAREVALQLVHIDYDRQMTFVVPVSGPAGEPQILAVVDTLTSPDNREAEYSLLVRSDARRSGLGRALLEKMMRYCRSRGTRTLFSMIAKDDVPMLSLAFKLGFQPDLEGEHDDDAEKMVLRLS